MQRRRRNCNTNFSKRESPRTYVSNNILNVFKLSAQVETKSLCKLLLHARMFLKTNLALPDYVSKEKKYALSYYLRTPASRTEREESTAKNFLDKLGRQLSKRGKSAVKIRNRKGKRLKKCRKEIWPCDLRFCAFATIKTNVFALATPRRLPAKKITMFSESTWQSNTKYKVKISCNKATPPTTVSVTSTRVRTAAKLASLPRSYYYTNSSITKETRPSKRREMKNIYPRDSWQQRRLECRGDAASQNHQVTREHEHKVC